MNVKTLKEILKDLPDDMNIILTGSTHEYSPLDSYHDEAIYKPESTWNGEVLYTSDIDEDNDLGKEEREVLKQQPRVLVLSPVN